MERASRTCHVLCWLAVVGFCLPAPAVLAQPPAPSAPVDENQITIHDVALQPGGLLKGQVIDANLRPSAGTEVTIQAANTTIATATSDTTGTFAVRGLRGGLHEIVTPTGHVVCRFWAPGTAPPCAIDQLAVVEDGTVVRGQAGPRFRRDFLLDAKAVCTHPLLLGGLVAAAIAIPTALRNADRAPGS